jgi:integrase
MAYTIGRKNGRWTAMYNTPDGKQRSAGTYDDEATAAEVGGAQEEYMRTGSKGVSPEERATTTIHVYFERWLAQHPVERSTKANYRDIYNGYIKNRFGQVRVAELEREAIRALLSELRERGLSRATQKSVRSLISGMMAIAIEDRYRSDNPAAGIRLPRESRGTQKIKVLTTDQFQALYAALPSDGARLLARVLISTGCRPSEAFVLTPADVHLPTCTISFTKALQKIDMEDSDDGLTTYIVGPTKTHEERHLKVDAGLIKALHQWVADHGIAEDALLFPRETTLPRRRATSVRAEAIVLTDELVASLGTKTAANGREYQHGTWPCYITAKCRECSYCRQAFADYRYDLEQRNRTNGHARGERMAEPFGLPYVTTQMWRSRFKEACVAAELPFIPDAYQLRHTHASWLVNKGEDIKTVRSRLGHTSLRTTAIYVEVVDDGQSSADIMEDLGLDWDVA